MAKPSTLNQKQLRFVQEYLLDLNATQAATRAGYSAHSAEVTGCKLLRNPKVAAAVAAGKAERVGRVEITQDYVLGVICSTIERCSREGLEFNPPAVLKGAELLGKHLGMFIERRALVNPDGSALVSNEQARKMAELFMRTETPVGALPAGAQA